MGVPFIITALETDRVVLQCTDGLKQVPFSAVIRWKLSAVTNLLAVGDRVKLNNTNLFYTIIEVFEVPYWKKCLSALLDVRVDRKGETPEANILQVDV